MNIYFNKKYTSILVGIVTLFSLFSCVPCTESDCPEVEFKDENFENVIRNILDNPDGKITEEDMLSIHEIYGAYNEITDIKGIEFCTNLHTLDLQHNNLTDISLLSDLTIIHYLNLRNNNIADISPISDLIIMEELYLNHNEIVDIGPIKPMRKIAKLFLHNNNIVNIEPLVVNSGIDDGDSVELRNNPLNSKSINNYIPRLERRGVTVHYKSYIPSTPEQHS